ncbi:MAG TPA: polysaccharide biosynthesis tyrosine autokinase, partial [Longimicrobiales bacterium]
YMDSLLADAQAELSAFRSRQKLFSSRERLIAEQAGLMAVEVRREELDAQRRMYEDLLAAVERAEPGKEREAFSALVLSPEMAGNPIVEQLFTQLARYEAKRDSLTSGVWARAPTDPDVIRLDSLIASTRAKLVTAARSHVTSLEARIDALDQLKARQAALLATLPSTETEEARLNLRAETLAKLAEQLREEYQRAQVAEAVGVGQVEIIDLAPVPIKPVGAGPVAKISLGLILGLMLGCGVAFLRENLNTKINRRSELETLLRVPGLVTVPSFSKNGAGKSARLLPLPLRNGKGQHATPGRGRELVVLSEPASVAAEAYRTLRTNLAFTQAVQQVRRLVVTSAAPSEGKTTTTANLAVAFAQQGARVLLVDCDLRRGRLHRVFDLPREPGLTELLVGIEKDHAKVSHRVAVDGLFVLPSGKLPPNPAELIGGSAMRDFLDRMTETYDLVILDSPPLLAAADAVALGTMADGVVIVVRAGQTDREAAQNAVQQLLAVGARVIGAVLNDPDARVQRYERHSYYYYYYRTEEA